MPTLTVVIPCYNEASRGVTERSFESRLAMLVSQLSSLDYRVILVDDGSTDDSVEVFMDFIEANQLEETWKLVRNEKNSGKGESLRRGIGLAETEFILLLDADMAVEPYTVVKLMQSVHEDECYVGTRYSATAKIVNHRTWLRKFISFCCRILVGMLFNIGVSDTQCGFKLIPTRLAKGATIYVKDTWLYDVEILYNLKCRGAVIKETPVRWNNLERESNIKAIESIIPSTKALFYLFSKKWAIQARYKKR